MHVIYHLRQGGDKLYALRVFAFVGLFVSRITCRRIFLMIFSAVGCLTCNKPFDFSADPDPGISNGIFFHCGIGPVERILWITCLGGGWSLRVLLELAICLFVCLQLSVRFHACSS